MMVAAAALLTAGLVLQPDTPGFPGIGRPIPAENPSTGPAPAELTPVELADLSLRERIIMRMPMQRGGHEAKAPPAQRWVEKGSVKCVPVDSVGGAILSGGDSIDLVVRGGERWRMRFSDECPALGFYQGFYFRPDKERKLCARRDVVYARSGGECTIWSIRKLIEKRPRER